MCSLHIAIDTIQKALEGELLLRFRHRYVDESCATEASDDIEGVVENFYSSTLTNNFVAKARPRQATKSVA